jgi:hypothetical protein
VRPVLKTKLCSQTVPVLLREVVGPLSMWASLYIRKVSSSGQARVTYWLPLHFFIFTHFVFFIILITFKNRAWEPNSEKVTNLYAPEFTE